MTSALPSRLCQGPFGSARIPWETAESNLVVCKTSSGAYLSFVPRRGSEFVDDPDDHDLHMRFAARFFPDGGLSEDLVAADPVSLSYSVSAGESAEQFKWGAVRVGEFYLEPRAAQLAVWELSSVRVVGGAFSWFTSDLLGVDTGNNAQAPGWVRKRGGMIVQPGGNTNPAARGTVKGVAHLPIPDRASIVGIEFFYDDPPRSTGSRLKGWWLRSIDLYGVEVTSSHRGQEIARTNSRALFQTNDQRNAAHCVEVEWTWQRDSPETPQFGGVRAFYLSPTPKRLVPS